MNNIAVALTKKKKCNNEPASKAPRASFWSNKNKTATLQKTTAAAANKKATRKMGTTKTQTNTQTNTANNDNNNNNKATTTTTTTTTKIPETNTFPSEPSEEVTAGEAPRALQLVSTSCSSPDVSALAAAAGEDHAAVSSSLFLGTMFSSLVSSAVEAATRVTGAATAVASRHPNNKKVAFHSDCSVSTSSTLSRYSSSNHSEDMSVSVQSHALDSTFEVIPEKQDDDNDEDGPHDDDPGLDEILMDYLVEGIYGKHSRKMGGEGVISFWGLDDDQSKEEEADLARSYDESDYTKDESKSYGSRSYDDSQSYDSQSRDKRQSNHYYDDNYSNDSRTGLYSF
ncbi:hypothetical protein ACA910_004660 [Epithemia clementina (nom. ined.)]